MSPNVSAAVAVKANETGSRSTVSGSAADEDETFAAIVELARAAGMLVTLDGQIGREKYQSIGGSLASFRRFVETLRRQLTAPMGAT